MPEAALARELALPYGGRSASWSTTPRGRGDSAEQILDGGHHALGARIGRLDTKVRMLLEPPLIPLIEKKDTP